MSDYFNATGTIGFTCDNCGRELLGCTWVNGMKFCAKCYQEIFGASKDWQLLDKDKNIAEQRKQIADLEAKLAESKESCILLEGLRKSEAEKKDIAIKRVSELKQQLAEKEKLLKKYLATSCPIYQDKISFAVERLRKAKFDALMLGGVVQGETFFINSEHYRNYIDNQIEELKKEMK